MSILYLPQKQSRITWRLYLVLNNAVIIHQFSHLWLQIMCSHYYSGSLSIESMQTSLVCD